MTRNSTTSLLLDEPPLIVIPSLAKLIGLNEAIVLQQIHYWLRKKERRPDQKYRHGGRDWVYNSYPEWQENFPFWSQATIARTIANLENMGVVLSFQRRSTDRRKWYTIDYERMQAITAECCVPS